LSFVAKNIWRGVVWIFGSFAGFLRGVLGNVGFACGVFVVKTWWNVWLSWTKNIAQKGLENWDTFLRIFFGWTN
jgi:hypothetical protein